MLHINANGKIDSSAPGVLELDDFDFSTLPDRPKNLNIDRQRSFDAIAEVPIGYTPVAPSRNESSYHFDSMFSPAKKSVLNTPLSQYETDSQNVCAEAWEYLRRSLVHFRGKPVGTIAALDNSDEKLNYDQVNFQITCG